MNQLVVIVCYSLPFKLHILQYFSQLLMKILYDDLQTVMTLKARSYLKKNLTTCILLFLARCYNNEKNSAINPLNKPVSKSCCMACLRYSDKQQQLSLNALYSSFGLPQPLFFNKMLDTIQTQQLSNLVKIHNDSLQILRIIKDESRKFKWQPLIPSIIFFFQGGGGRSCGCSINNAEERFNVMNFSTVC